MLQAVHGWSSTYERLVKSQKFFSSYLTQEDLSRFGRDHVEVEHYLQHIFPHLGVRFVAISDGYDSADASTFDRLAVALKNIVNNIYSKDISLKSGSVLREKQIRGEFIGAYASYGYIKDPRDRHRIIPDPETAQVVREIYRRKLEGQGDTAITRWLNASGILSPSSYRYQKGIIRDERYAQPKPWLVQTVKTILRSEVYLGHMVQGRRICEFYANRPNRMLPQNEWTVVKNTHEPLISQEDFDRVQEINRQAKEAYHANLGKYDALGKTENLLKGLVFCAECGRPLVRYKQVTSKGKYVHYYYLCPNYAAQLERSGCTYKFVPEEKLIGAVEAVAAKEILLAADLKALTMQKAAQHMAAAEETGRALKGALAEQNKLHALRERLLRDEAYRDFLTGLLNRRGFYYAVDSLRKEDMPLALFLCDLDNMKQANDAYGHAEGDRLIRRFGELLRSHTRETDIVARFGGDEFAVVMKRMGSEETALKKGKAICRAARESCLEGAVPAAASAGVVIWDAEGPVQDVIARADRALYRAKADGKDGCRLWKD